jgi:predicted glycoside hydrolase/deacetylase ChbG (UPF0249 family)
MTSSRTVIPHVDDLGASHGANQAFFELSGRGLVTCGSVMVPGPWFREVAEAACDDQALDIGVHLTLTSEWKTCRWAPISTVSRASGLIDDDGYFWRDLGSLRQHLVAEAAELELRAQIERAIEAGIRPTHIDAHMAAAMLPELLNAHVRLAFEYQLFPVLPRSITWAPDAASYAHALAGLDAVGAPVVDHCRGTLAVDAATLDQDWAELLRKLPAGLTHLALHCTAPGDFTAMSPDHAGWRTAEYDLLARGRLADLLGATGIATIGTRSLQALWLSSAAVAAK